MQSQQLEARVLAIVDLVRAGQRVEDAFVELKRGLLEPNAVARRLGGQANAARGEPILWLIGVDEKTGEVVPVADDHAGWLARVRSSFDQLAPDLLADRWVPIGEGRVLALLFDTTRGPYVVRNPAHGAPGGGGGPVQLEVPWREGTAVRSARRDDLLRILAPPSRLPAIELLIAYGWRFDAERPWSFGLSCYLTPQSEAPVVIPFHRVLLLATLPSGAIERCSVTLDSLENVEAAAEARRLGGLIGVREKKVAAHPSNVRRSLSELTLIGPGRVEAEGKLESEFAVDRLRLQLSLGIAGADSPLIVECTLQGGGTGNKLRWLRKR